MQIFLSLVIKCKSGILLHHKGNLVNQDLSKKSVILVYCPEKLQAFQLVYSAKVKLDIPAANKEKIIQCNDTQKKITDTKIRLPDQQNEKAIAKGSAP